MEKEQQLFGSIDSSSDDEKSGAAEEVPYTGVSSEEDEVSNDGTAGGDSADGEEWASDSDKEYAAGDFNETKQDSAEKENVQDAQDLDQDEERQELIDSDQDEEKQDFIDSDQDEERQELIDSDQDEEIQELVDDSDQDEERQEEFVSNQGEESQELVDSDQDQELQEEVDSDQDQEPQEEVNSDQNVEPQEVIDSDQDEEAENAVISDHKEDLPATHEDSDSNHDNADFSKIDSDDEQLSTVDKDEVKSDEVPHEESDEAETLAITYAESEKSDDHENEERHSASNGSNSEEEEDRAKKLKNQLDLSSSDEDATQETGKVDNLFGDADDISSDDDEAEDTEKRARLVVSDDEDNLGQGEEMEEAVEEQEKEVVETRIEVEIPKIKTDLGSAIYFIRFPNFISAEPRPFDPAVYEDEIEEDELLDEEGRTRLKLKVENTIRWKKYTDENGIELTESNARIVRWSDGSMSMHLGSEIFDVHQMPLQGDHNHLFIRQGTGLQGQAVFRTKLTFRPHSTKSATHKKMTNRLAMRHNQNQQKVRVLPIAGQDPESRKAALMKEEEEQLKAHVRREAQKRRLREKSHARGLTTSYLDHRYDDGTTNDEEDEGISVSAIKNKFKSGPAGVGGFRRERIYSSDSDSEGEKRLMNAKRLSSDDEDDGIGGKRRREEESESRKKTYIVSDEEDEEEDTAMLSA